MNAEPEFAIPCIGIVWVLANDEPVARKAIASSNRSPAFRRQNTLLVLPASLESVILANIR